VSAIFPPNSTSPQAADGDVLAERVFGSLIATFELAAIHLGDRLGLYRALADATAATAGELATSTATDSRYVREWLEQQAAAGILACENPQAAPDQRRFELPAAHYDALLNPESLTNITGLARFAIGVLSPLADVIEAFRTGEGVPYAAYGSDTREGIAAANRPVFTACLGQEWLPAVADVDARLSAPGAHVADLGCGLGWSTLAIGRAYPLARVDGFDEDVPSIDAARINAEAAGLSDRVRFYRQDVADDALTGAYDLVTIFEALHDMARPVDALRAARQLLAAGGCVIVADERVAERFTAPADDPVERLSYAASVLHCLPVGRTDENAAATGTVMRPHTVRDYATQAGYGSVEVLPIDNDLWRFYRLNP
jgi:2-polyprenyl-3-methyl-5-hydroxy-6-metoxy-1,4-benzoquinol methylase